MNFLSKLEYKYGKYAIRNLNVYLAIIYLIGFLVVLVDPRLYSWYFSLNIGAVLHGQIWRCITFIFYPPAVSSSILLTLLAIYIYYSFSKYLLMVWSDFKFNIYILCGILGHVIGGILAYFITGENLVMDSTYLTFSIFIAFALTFPDSMFLLFFFIPIKAKYLAYFEIAVYIISLIGSPLDTKISIICSLLNVVLFLYFTYGANFKHMFNKFFRKKY